MKWDNILQKYLSEPSIRAVRLWQNSIEDANSPDFLKDGAPVIAKKDKFQFNLDENMYGRLHMIHKIFVIRKVPNLQSPKISILRGREKIMALKKQTHRPGLIIGEDIQERYQRFVKNLVRFVPVYFVRRPENIPIQEFVDFMEDKIK